MLAVVVGPEYRLAREGRKARETRLCTSTTAPRYLSGGGSTDRSFSSRRELLGLSVAVAMEVESEASCNGGRQHSCIHASRIHVSMTEVQHKHSSVVKSQPYSRGRGIQLSFLSFTIFTL